MKSSDVNLIQNPIFLRARYGVSTKEESGAAPDKQPPVGATSVANLRRRLE